MGIKGVIFDSDGVIFDSEYVHYLAFKEAFGRYDYNLTESHFEKLKGMSSKDIIADCFPEANAIFIEGLSKERSELFVQKYSTVAPLVKGVRQFIDYLRNGNYGVIVVTNGLRENSQSMMKYHKLNLDVLAVQDFIIPKPDPAGYKMALEKLSLNPNEAVVFEDSPLGISAAKSAGIMCIGVMTKHNEAELKEAGADHAIKDFSDLKKLKEILN